jgi:transposase
MGRLSAYAKNRILKLRFKKNKRIIHIVEILKRDDNIKVSRQAVSTFVKKYLETNSIYDKPRTGRKRKLTGEEIQLIGQVTRLNRDITARAIKEYLNLNVSTYTILRATKLFEWNKVNPNSNDSKKQAAIDKQLRMEEKARKRGLKKKDKGASSADKSGENSANSSHLNGSSDNNTSIGDLSSTSVLSESNHFGDDESDLMSESGEIEKIQPRGLNKQISNNNIGSIKCEQAPQAGEEIVERLSLNESNEQEESINQENTAPAESLAKPKPRITAHSIPGMYKNS